MTGSSYNRRRRKQWLIDTYGNGITVVCFLGIHPRCRKILTIATVWVDRIVPGCLGGTYQRDNIQPACDRCQMLQGGQIGQSRRGRGKGEEVSAHG